jgi:hypothetical protein
MKQIIIYQDGGSPILIKDDDKTPIEEYTRKTSSLLESNNVSILHTSTCSTIIRPSKISAITVEDIDTENFELGQQQETAKEEIQEDIISD